MQHQVHSNDHLIIVGNRFSAFARSINGKTLGELLAMPTQDLRQIRTIQVGQGIGWNCIRLLYTQMRPLLESGHLTIIEDASRLVSPDMVHKHRMENVMVTHPVVVSERAYRSRLVIDESCAELSDHIAGIHMQGSVFIEAARQMFMASSRNHAKELSCQNYVYTLQRVQVNFKGFLYPLPIDVDLTIDSSRVIRDILSGEATIRFSQHDEVGVEVSFKARAYKPDVLAAFEHERAQRSMTRMIDMQREAALAMAGALQA